MSHFDDSACLVPFGRVWSSLVLDPDLVTHLERGESPGVLSESFSHLHVTISEGFLSGKERLLPCRVRFISPWMDGYKVPYWSAKYALDW